MTAEMIQGRCLMWLDTWRRRASTTCTASSTVEASASDTQLSETDAPGGLGPNRGAQPPPRQPSSALAAVLATGRPGELPDFPVCESSRLALRLPECTELADWESCSARRACHPRSSHTARFQPNPRHTAAAKMTHSPATCCSLMTMLSWLVEALVHICPDRMMSRSSWAMMPESSSRASAPSSTARSESGVLLAYAKPMSTGSTRSPTLYMSHWVPIMNSTQGASSTSASTYPLRSCAIMMSSSGWLAQA
mmetsp:Transcript_32479/g.82514  ORF Transcript_32479/g.82514 Transcript_32479/m.82514 type:complete len:251 (-) Transcript_32479:917-1669(-)